ncbi:MAG: hypothetical protein Q7T76_22305, partial [Ferruginibacter sp.]|nr:hypothetical protein [Ferruginibacter sp.]
ATLQNNMRMLFIISFLVITGCTSKVKFDKNKWLVKDDFEYPFREAMIKDLTINHKLKGLSQKELSNLLGEPAHYADDQSHVYYTIYEKYRWNDIDPVGGMTLVFAISNDSSVLDFKVNKW